MVLSGVGRHANDSFPDNWKTCHDRVLTAVTGQDVVVHRTGDRFIRGDVETAAAERAAQRAQHKGVHVLSPLPWRSPRARTAGAACSTSGAGAPHLPSAPPNRLAPHPPPACPPP